MADKKSIKEVHKNETVTDIYCTYSQDVLHDGKICLCDKEFHLSWVQIENKENKSKSP